MLSCILRPNNHNEECDATCRLAGFGVSFLIHPLFGNDTRHAVPLSSSPALKVGASQPPVSPDIYFFGAPTTYYLLLMADLVLDVEFHLTTEIAVALLFLNLTTLLCY